MRRRIVGAAAVGLLVTGVVLAWRGRPIAQGHVRMRVRGVVVDGKTGAPVQGATLRTEGSSATTDGSGAFEAIALLAFAYETNWLGIVTGRTQASPFETVRSLRVERDGFLELVHDAKDARWIEQRDGEIVGTLDVGTIRLARR
jgi:hypothetical protein